MFLKIREFLVQIVTPSSTISSARFVNVCGFVVASGLLIFDSITHLSLLTPNFIAYLTYCAGGYAISKGLSCLEGSQKND